MDINKLQTAYSEQAEQSVIGGLFLDNTQLENIKEILSINDFYIESHKILFTAIISLDKNGISIDPITVSEHLTTHSLLNKIGGSKYLGMLVTNTPSAANIIDYANIVSKKSIQRQLLQASMDGDFNRIKQLTSRLEVNNNEVLPLNNNQHNTNKFPIDALGSILKNAVNSIVNGVQCPVSLAAQSLLAAATLATQGIAKVESPRSIYPMLITNYYLLIGEPGEGKGATESIAFMAIRNFERQLIETHEQALEDYKKSQKQKSDEDFEVNPPAASVGVLCEEPTLPFIQKGFIDGKSIVMLLNEDAAAFFAGWSMQDDRRSSALANLCKLSDTGAGKYQRASQPDKTFYDRTFSMSVGIQPSIWEGMKQQDDQGLLSRLLIVYPDSTIGNRPFQRFNALTDANLAVFNDKINYLLEYSFNKNRINEKGEIDFATLKLSKEAEDCYIDYYNQHQKELKKGGCLFDVRRSQNKFDKQPLKIAGVLTLFNNPDARSIEVDAMMNAIIICSFYMEESHYIFGDTSYDVDLQNAEELYEWLNKKGLKYADNRVFTLSNILKYAPRKFRKRKVVEPVLKTLETHNYGYLKVSGQRKNTYTFTVINSDQLQFKL